ncbi:SPOCS domain-containing protein [Haloimpatiens sp. FM7315]|uniref:DUF3794 and LysM peptidoglycan-binding domain-containing protein n=1 Tax=Haloimpatiens sp. FM7315 TaxID=3298609 RepID=UPI0035A2C773
MELIRENIEYEQLLGENTADTIIRQEFIIPDTHPDVEEILMIEAKPRLTSKEVMQNKIYIEGQVNYNVLYLAKGEKESEVFNVTYNGTFSNAIEINGAEREMISDIESYVEHMECSIYNERKISIEGIIKLKASVYKNYAFDIVKDLKESNKIEMLKNPTSIDKILSIIPGEIIGKCHMQIPVEESQISEIMKHNVNISKEEVKVYDNKIKLEAMAHVEILYKSKDSRDLRYLENDILLSNEIENEILRADMKNYTDFKLDAFQLDLREDDLGEKRIIDIEVLVKTNTKLMIKEEINMIEDAYSPQNVLDIQRKNYPLNVIHGQITTQVLVKGEISLDSNMPKSKKIITSSGNVCITDKKLVEDKVVIEGILDVKVLYKSEDKDKYVYSVQDEIPFTCSVEMPGTKIDMNCVAKAKLENIEANVEPGDIAIKALVNVYVRVSYITNKDFIISLDLKEDEIQKKKASITIYVVQNGDTLWKIAKKYNSKLEDLAKINNIEDMNTIKVGDKLIIPGRAII